MTKTQPTTTYNQRTSPLPYAKGQRRTVQHGNCLVTQVFTDDGWWNIDIQPIGR